MQINSGNYKVLKGATKNSDHVVLLHGWLQSMAGWEYTARKINKRYGVHVLLVDFYGHGESSWQRRKLEEVHVLKFVEQVRAVICKIGWENHKCIFGGISMGAATSVNYALRHPENVKRLLLVCPAGPRETVASSSWGPQIMYYPICAIDWFLEAIYLREFVYQSDMIWKSIAKAYVVNKAPQYCVPEDAATQLSELNIRTNLIAARFDFTHTYHNQVQFYQPEFLETWYTNHPCMCKYIEHGYGELAEKPWLWFGPDQKNYQIVPRAKL